MNNNDKDETKKIVDAAKEIGITKEGLEKIVRDFFEKKEKVKTKINITKKSNPGIKNKQ